MRRLRPSIRFPTSTRHCRRTFHRGAPNLFSNGQNTPEPVGMGFMASLLRSRAVVRFRGHDTLKFLHGLLTNDVRRFGGRSMAAPPMYAALLTPHGRFLYDMFVYRLDGFDSDGPFELLMDVDSSQVEEFLETFKRYRLRSKVEIENVTDEFSCWQCYGDGVSKEAPRVHEPDDTEADWNASVDQFVLPASQETNARLQWFRDPRLPCLGFRGIFPAKSTPPLVESAREVGEQNYLLWRVEHGVAEGSTEIPKGEAFPLEYNFAGLNAISFDKGCYVGQELVARTHHQGVIRKRLLPLKFHDHTGKELEDKVAPGLEVINMASDKKAGIVTSVFGCRGLGLLRLDDALKGGGTLAVQGQESVKVKGTKPEWWPSEWFQ